MLESIGEKKLGSGIALTYVELKHYCQDSGVTSGMRGENYEGNMYLSVSRWYQDFP